MSQKGYRAACVHQFIEWTLQACAPHPVMPTVSGIFTVRLHDLKYGHESMMRLAMSVSIIMQFKVHG